MPTVQVMRDVRFEGLGGFAAPLTAKALGAAVHSAAVAETGCAPSVKLTPEGMLGPLGALAGFARSLDMAMWLVEPHAGLSGPFRSQTRSLA